MIQEIKRDLVEKMERAILFLEKDLSALRAGKASVNLLNKVIVEIYGKKMPISQVSTISVLDTRTLAVQVWDKSILKVIEKSIAAANLGLSIASEGQVIRISLPLLSQERRQELVKLAYKYGENTKVSLRSIRRDGIECLKKVKKSGNLSKDEEHSIAEEIQKLTDKFISKVSQYIRAKEEEILKIT